MHKTIATLFAGLLCCAAVQAFPIGMQPVADGTRLSVQGEAQVSVDNDEGVVYFYVAQTGPQLSDVTRDVIEAVTKGMEGLHAAFPQATFETRSFVSQPKYDKTNKKIIAWEVRQSISAQLPAFQAAALVHDLAQGGFAFENVTFRLSFKAEQAVQKQLSSEVLESAAAKAEAIAMTMGLTSADVKVQAINFTQRNTGVARPLLAASLRSNSDSSEAMPIPTFDRGRTVVSLSGNASFVIKRELAGVAPQPSAAGTGGTPGAPSP